MISVNPAGVTRDGYIAFLNRVFPGQWDRTSYDWYVGRTFGAASSDTLVRADDSQILSGMVVSPRRLRRGTERMDVGVISAAATLSTERGRGHYAALLAAAVERGRERGMAALLGFVTSDNASGRGLTRLGALTLPSFYVHSRTGSMRRLVPRRMETHSPDAAEQAEGLWRSGHLTRTPVDPVQFHYDDLGDWQQQFIDRPHGVRLVRPLPGCRALIEAVGLTDRLQLLDGPRQRRMSCVSALASASHASGRKFFMYTLDAHEAAAACRAGLRARSGFLMALPTGCDAVRWKDFATCSWSVESGDRL